jgi:hypothetical protein
MTELTSIIFSMYEMLCALEHCLHRFNTGFLDYVSHCQFWAAFDLKAHEGDVEVRFPLTKVLHNILNDYLDCQRTCYTYFYRKLDSDDTYRIYLPMNSKAELSAVSTYLCEHASES